jgi:hypothetical protein
VGTIAWKIIGTAGTALAGVLAAKLVDAVWAGSGQDGIDPRNPEVPVVKALAYVVLTSLVVGGAKTLATRGAAQYYARSSGQLPKELRARVS